MNVANQTTRLDTALDSAWSGNPPRYRRDIEGLRAFAVLAVVAFHARVPGLGGGYIGVDVFFVLSGYLITWLLVHEARTTGSVDFWAFYGRRIRRLLPAMALMLTVTGVFAILLLAPFEQKANIRSWVSTGLYVSNLDFAIRALDYHGALTETNALLHTWSLSVEEQFYLVWPALFPLGLGLLGPGAVAKGPVRATRLLVLLTGVCLASFVLCLVLLRVQPNATFYLSPPRAWEFGVGGLAVLLPRAGLAGTRRLYDTAVGWGAALLLVACVALYSERTPFPGWATVAPVMATVALLRVGSTPLGASGLTPTLSSPPLQWIGKLSYSWYLWHWPFLVFAETLADPLPPVGRLAAVALSLLVSWLSFRFVENPIRRSAKAARRPRRSVVAAMTMSITIVAFAAAWRWASTAWSTTDPQQGFSTAASELPRVSQGGCDQWWALATARLDPARCEYGDPDGTAVVVLVGDSHAAQFFPALEAALPEDGVQLVVFTLSACAFVQLTPEVVASANPNLRCSSWNTALVDELATMAPSTVFVASYAGGPLSPSLWETATRGMLSQLVEFGHRVVLIADPGRVSVDAPRCLARAAWRAGSSLDPDCRLVKDAGSAVGSDAQVRGAVSAPGVEVLDLRGEVCPGLACDPWSNGLIRYRDNNHISVEFARSLAHHFRPWMTPTR